MKIVSLSVKTSCELGKPVQFDVELPGLILDASIVFGHSVAALKMTVLDEGEKNTVKLLAVRAGHEHADLSAVEFVCKMEAYRHTSAMESYYLFTVSARG